ncbi:MAG: hypothetical protein ACR2J7_02045 [Luteimonas sp.]
MTDIVLKDVDAVLEERIKRVADKRGWSIPKTLVHLLEHGLYTYEGDGQMTFDHSETDALQAAIAALEEVADDSGYALIGKLPSAPDTTD